MPTSTIKLVFLVLLISILVSVSNPRDESETASDLSLSVALACSDQGGAELVYDFYRDTCARAESIVRSTMTQIFSLHNDAPAALLRLLFHDCFIQGCDASVMLDDSHGNQNQSNEKQAVPNQTLRGFDKIDMIKDELEKACPGMVSCADTLALATRDGIVLAGGPFYPVLTGRRDSTRSFFNEATSDIPNPDDNITEILHLFGVRGFSERETVTLLGGHSIGKIGCEFINNRINNFTGTGQPDPAIPSDFLYELRTKCQESNSSTGARFTSFVRSRGMGDSTRGVTNDHELLSSVSSGAGFDTHYYHSLLRGRGILFSDQQLMADQNTAKFVNAYASDDGPTFQRDFAQVMVKISNLGVLTGSQGQVRVNCSMPISLN